MIRRLKVLLVLVVSARVCWAQPSIPATPAGRALAAWLEAFNSGDRAKIDLFLTNYAPRLKQDGPHLGAIPRAVGRRESDLRHQRRT